MIASFSFRRPVTRRTTRLIGRAAIACTLGLAGTLAACAVPDVTGTPNSPPPPSNGRTPGYVTGTVVDAAGRPLSGVQVFADNTLFYNTNAIGVTDAQGRYRIDVREPTGTWHMSAQLTRQFEGRTYRFNPQPTVNDPFPGVDGAVRDFTWRLEGRTPAGGHYGARVYTRVIPAGFLYDSDDRYLEITMTPVGPLVDGSTGAPRTIRGDADWAAYYVPLGRYRFTARYAPPGIPARDAVVRVAGSGPFIPAVEATWATDGSGYPKMLEIEITAPPA